MATELYAGTLADFDNAGFDYRDSMATSIEHALEQLLGPLPTAPPNLVADRRNLFIAISRGVIDHLKANEAAFKIDVKAVWDPATFKVSTSTDLEIVVKG